MTRELRLCILSKDKKGLHKTSVHIMILFIHESKRIVVTLYSVKDAANKGCLCKLDKNDEIVT